LGSPKIKAPVSWDAKSERSPSDIREKAKENEKKIVCSNHTMGTCRICEKKKRNYPLKKRKDNYRGELSEMGREGERSGGDTEANSEGYSTNHDLK